MNCPSCGNPLPEGIGQHAVAPVAGVVDCPSEIEQKEQS
jgi:hypothetical protein